MITTGPKNISERARKNYEFHRALLTRFQDKHRWEIAEKAYKEAQRDEAIVKAKAQYENLKKCVPNYLELKAAKQKLYREKQAVKKLLAPSESKAKTQEALAKYKLERGCVDCGYKEHAVALEFDHVRGTKYKNLSQIHNLQEAMEEVEKCEVRCANCHRIVTKQRIDLRKNALRKTLEEIEQEKIAALEYYIPPDIEKKIDKITSVLGDDILYG